MFIGIIVDAMQTQHEAEHVAEQESTKAELDEILDEVRTLRKEVKSLPIARETT